MRRRVTVVLCLCLSIDNVDTYYYQLLPLKLVKTSNWTSCRPTISPVRTLLATLLTSSLCEAVAVFTQPWWIFRTAESLRLNSALKPMEFSCSAFRCLIISLFSSLKRIGNLRDTHNDGRVRVHGYACRGVISIIHQGSQNRINSLNKRIIPSTIQSNLLNSLKVSQSHESVSSASQDVKGVNRDNTDSSRAFYWNTCAHVSRFQSRYVSMVT